MADGSRITGQRMDGCIVLNDSGTVEPTASVRLMRDLRRGDRVVVGIDGIQTVRKSESREERGIGGAPAAEFAFMGAGVSSERKIELVVREIAWELERIRERGGKVVVVAGPVIIHTGASEHLAALIRAGFVHVVLGGNGMAVHDIEQALLGTSLGVDMTRGTQVHGGHRHHLARYQYDSSMREHRCRGRTGSAQERDFLRVRSSGDSILVGCFHPGRRSLARCFHRHDRSPARLCPADRGRGNDFDAQFDAP